MYQT